MGVLPSRPYPESQRTFSKQNLTQGTTVLDPSCQRY